MVVEQRVRIAERKKASWWSAAPGDHARRFPKPLAQPALSPGCLRRQETPGKYSHRVSHRIAETDDHLVCVERRGSRDFGRRGQEGDEGGESQPEGQQRACAAKAALVRLAHCRNLIFCCQQEGFVCQFCRGAAARSLRESLRLLRREARAGEGSAKIAASTWERNAKTTIKPIQMSRLVWKLLGFVKIDESG